MDFRILNWETDMNKDKLFEEGITYFKESEFDNQYFIKKEKEKIKKLLSLSEDLIWYLDINVSGVGKRINDKICNITRQFRGKKPLINKLIFKLDNFRNSLLKNLDTLNSSSNITKDQINNKGKSLHNMFQTFNNDFGKITQQVIADSAKSPSLVTISNFLKAYSNWLKKI